jgi:hypothetical protein
VGGGLHNGAHLVQPDLRAIFRRLPRCFHTGEPAADHIYYLHTANGNLYSPISEISRFGLIRYDDEKYNPDFGVRVMKVNYLIERADCFCR